MTHAYLMNYAYLMNHAYLMNPLWGPYINYSITPIINCMGVVRYYTWARDMGISKAPVLGTHPGQAHAQPGYIYIQSPTNTPPWVHTTLLE